MPAMPGEHALFAAMGRSYESPEPRSPDIHGGKRCAVFIVPTPRGGTINRMMPRDSIWRFKGQGYLKGWVIQPFLRLARGRSQSTEQTIRQYQ